MRGRISVLRGIFTKGNEMVARLSFVALVLVILYVTGVLSFVAENAIALYRYGKPRVTPVWPISVDIDRLDLAIGRLDVEVASNGHKVAGQSVALDRFATEVSVKEQALVQSKDVLRAMRNKFVVLQDAEAKKPLEDAMAKQLARFKARAENLAVAQAALQERRKAYEALLSAFRKQQLDRDILKEKLQQLRAEYETMKMRGELEDVALSNAVSRKASELAIEIADRLELERRLFELKATETFDQPMPETPVSFNLSDIEKAIGGNDACPKQMARG